MILSWPGPKPPNGNRVVKYAVAAHQMGIADHWAATARQAGGKIVVALDHALAQLGWAERDAILTKFAAEVEGWDGDDEPGP